MSNNKTNQFHFRLTDEELTFLRYSAHLSDLTVTEYIKFCTGITTNTPLIIPQEEQIRLEQTRDELLNRLEKEFLDLEENERRLKKEKNKKRNKQNKPIKIDVYDDEEFTKIANNDFFGLGIYLSDEEPKRSAR